MPKPVAYDSTSERLLASYRKKKKGRETKGTKEILSLWDPHPAALNYK